MFRLWSHVVEFFDAMADSTVAFFSPIRQEFDPMPDPEEQDPVAQNEAAAVAPIGVPDEVDPAGDIVTRLEEAADRAEIAADHAGRMAADAQNARDAGPMNTVAMEQTPPPPFVDIYSAGSDAVKGALAVLRVAKERAVVQAERVVSMKAEATHAEEQGTVMAEAVEDARHTVVETMRAQKALIEGYPGVVLSE